ncbi:hypothetical protein CAF53_03275 [Sphingobium sp. LB126]|nr:hypothetical protein CAF53_03275 [Sphingobium sp. LB126]
MDFAGRVAIVTGAGRGLGRSHALMLSARGARVVVNDLTPDAGLEDAATDVVREIRERGGVAVADHHDITEDAAAVVATAIDSFGRLDILINNAGIVRSAHFADADLGEWEQVFRIHFDGTVAMCAATTTMAG